MGKRKVSPKIEMHFTHHPSQNASDGEEGRKIEYADAAEKMQFLQTLAKGAVKMRIQSKAA